MDEYIVTKDKVYEAYFAMKDYAEDNCIIMFNNDNCLGLLYEFNGVLNTPDRVMSDDENEHDSTSQGSNKPAVEVIGKKSLNQLTIDEWLETHNVYSIKSKPAKPSTLDDFVVDM